MLVKELFWNAPNMTARDQLGRLWFYMWSIRIVYNFICDTLLAFATCIFLLCCFRCWGFPYKYEVSLRWYLCLQIFFLGGRFIFGPDVRSLALTIFLIVAPVAVFCVFVARKLMDDFPNDWGISITVAAVVFTIYVSSLSSLSGNVLYTFEIHSTYSV